MGACASTGALICKRGHVVDSCAPGPRAADDTTCDGLDEDCDGTADEDYASVPTTCGVGTCAAAGSTSCTAGAVVDSCIVGPPASSDVTCDGADEDCDGMVDED